MCKCEYNKKNGDGNSAKAEGGGAFRKSHSIIVYELLTFRSYFGLQFDQKTSKTFFLGVVQYIMFTLTSEFSIIWSKQNTKNILEI